jgi:type II secretory pathway pseudopilin PulG
MKLRGPRKHGLRLRLSGRLRRGGQEEGYIIILVMLVLMVVGMMATTLLASISVNQQHVSRDRAFTQSLAVAEAGLNQFLWMVADGKSTEMNEFAIYGDDDDDPHVETFTLADKYDPTKIAGTYTIQVTPPTPSDSRVAVTVTGSAESPVDVPRTVSAHIGRPSFSEYVLLVDDQVYIGGPVTRVWHGKTHSNEGIRIETANITDTVSCARATYRYDSDGQTHPGVWSQGPPDGVPTGDASRGLWQYPVPPVDFGTVRSDFERLSSLATGGHNLPRVPRSGGSAGIGWYIKILPNEQYQVGRVTKELEGRNYSDWGSITVVGLTTRDYPNKGVIYVNDDVWIEGTNVEGRLTIASSGQLNNPATTTNIHVVDDLMYAAKDGSAVIGLIAQNNVEIPMYAPRSKSVSQTTNMEIDAALIAQQGWERVNRDENSMGPKRGKLTFYGSVSSYGTPSRATTSGSNYCGFKDGENTYDFFLLHNPPPYFPTIGSYQILDWRELPSFKGVPATAD